MRRLFPALVMILATLSLFMASTAQAQSEPQYEACLRVFSKKTAECYARNKMWVWLDNNVTGPRVAWKGNVYQGHGNGPGPSMPTAWDLEDGRFTGQAKATQYRIPVWGVWLTTTPVSPCPADRPAQVGVAYKAQKSVMVTLIRPGVIQAQWVIEPIRCSRA